LFCQRCSACSTLPASTAYLKAARQGISPAETRPRPAVLIDFAALSLAERRAQAPFRRPVLRATALTRWERTARFSIAASRIEVSRMGGSRKAAILAAELPGNQYGRRRLWTERLRSRGGGVKRFRHPRQAR
jgi:hypothetical protein